MKFLMVSLLVVSTSIYAQVPFDLDQICELGDSQITQEKIESKDTSSSLIIADNGFCEVYKQTKQEELKESLAYKSNPKDICEVPTSPTLNFLNKDEKKKEKFKIRFYASHSFTTYFKTDLKLRSSRYNVDIKDYEWAERGSRNFFEWKTLTADGNHVLQWIDEPSNTFTISIEKNGHEFFLSAFHPKFLQQDDQIKYMQGTIDGTAVDGYQYINEPFDGYNQRPGEMELARNQNTHMQMIFELGYGKRFDLIKGKWGSISYTPSVGAGVTFGQNLTVVVKEDQWWDFDEYKDKTGIQGFGGSVHNRLEFNSKNERFGVFYDNRFSFYKQKHGFMDGTQEYDLKLMGNSVGVKFMLYNPNRKRKKKKS